MATVSHLRSTASPGSSAATHSAEIEPGSDRKDVYEWMGGGSPSRDRLVAGGWLALLTFRLPSETGYRLHPALLPALRSELPNRLPFFVRNASQLHISYLVERGDADELQRTTAVARYLGSMIGLDPSAIADVRIDPRSSTVQPTRPELRALPDA